MVEYWPTLIVAWLSLFPFASCYPAFSIRPSTSLVQRNTLKPLPAPRTLHQLHKRAINIRIDRIDDNIVDGYGNHIDRANAEAQFREELAGAVTLARSALSVINDGSFNPANNWAWQSFFHTTDPTLIHRVRGTHPIDHTSQQFCIIISLHLNTY